MFEFAYPVAVALPTMMLFLWPVFFGALVNAQFLTIPDKVQADTSAELQFSFKEVAFIRDGSTPLVENPNVITRLTINVPEDIGFLGLESNTVTELEEFEAFIIDRNGEPIDCAVSGSSFLCDEIRLGDTSFEDIELALNGLTVFFLDEKSTVFFNVEGVDVNNNTVKLLQKVEVFEVLEDEPSVGAIIFTLCCCGCICCTCIGGIIALSCGMGSKKTTITSRVTIETGKSPSKPVYSPTATEHQPDVGLPIIQPNVSTSYQGNTATYPSISTVPVAVSVGYGTQDNGVDENGLPSAIQYN